MAEAHQEDNLEGDVFVKCTKNQCRDFNVSSFLRRYKRSFDAATHSQIQRFALYLDKAVHIDRKDPFYGYIVKGIERVIDKICTELVSMKPGTLENLSVQPTGSLYCDTKVGLPLEVDFLLIFPETTDVTAAHFGYIFQSLWEKLNLTSVYEGITVLGYRKHTSGICLAMEYNQNGYESIGIVVDLVPVVHVEHTKDEVKIRDKAKILIDDYLPADVLVNRMYKLRRHNHERPDTGLVQTELLLNLDDNTRVGYRLAKYLTQMLHYGTNDLFDSDLLRGMDEKRAIKIYGYKPWISSYVLRVCFMHLLIATHEREEAKELKGATLTVCLLEMLLSILPQHITGSSSQDFIDLENPFQSFTERKRLNSCYSERKLVNSPTSFSSRKENPNTSGATGETIVTSVNNLQELNEIKEEFIRNATKNAIQGNKMYGIKNNAIMRDKDTGLYRYTYDHDFCYMTTFPHHEEIKNGSPRQLMSRCLLYHKQDLDTISESFVDTFADRMTMTPKQTQSDNIHN